MTESFQRLLQRIPIALFAIDEAHYVSQWGHDFRPEYLRIAEVTKRFEGVSKIALTATADAHTRKDIIAKRELSQAAQFVSSFDRPNIRYRVQLRVRRIVEKPKREEIMSPYAASILFILPSMIWEYLAMVTPSERGEIELQSAVDMMIQDGMKAFGVLQPAPDEWEATRHLKPGI